MQIADLHKHFIKEQQNFTTDTRSITKGAIFFALKGDNFNGNKFAQQAIDAGASLVVIDEAEFAIDNKTYVCENVLQTLQELASYHRNYLNIPIIGLTGSNGKTTTKELIREVLKQQFKVTATVGNLNNHIGVPLTLLSMTPDTEIGIVEMGANHQKEIELLANIAQPNYGYITNFGKAHMEGFGGVEGIIKGKSELYDYLAKSNGKAFVNLDDSKQIEKASKCENIDIIPSDYPLKKLNPYVVITTENQTINSNLIGKYNYTNIVAAITIGTYLNIPLNKIKKGIEEYTPTNNRSQIVEKNGIKIILDAYNANPTSMKAALDNLKALDTENKAIIIGDMFELGETSLEEHQHIADLVKSYNFNQAYLVGENFYSTNTTISKFANYEDFKAAFTNNLKNHTLLIKGSRGMALERMLELL